MSESKTIFGKFQADLLVRTFASGLTDEKLLKFSAGGNLFSQEMFICRQTTEIK